jgi:ribosomal protein S18 acetylase RimI-like enzyme
MKFPIPVKSKKFGNVKIHFRPVEENDGEFLFNVYAGTRRDELAPLPWTESRKQQFLRMQFEAQDKHYRQHYSEDDFLIVLMGDIPVGRLYLGRWEEEIRIIDIALLPDHRGAGIGSAILKEILREAKKSEKAVRIHVEKNNPALHLYNRLGFKKIADRGVYDLMQWHPN